MKIFWPKTFEHEFSQIYGVGTEKQTCDGFHFKFFPEKSNDKTLWKLILGTFFLFRANKNFSEKSACHFFSVSRFLRQC